MNNYEKIREACWRCEHCNSNNNLEVHHRIFRSELEKGVTKNININKKIFKESRWVELHYWWLNDIENLVVLCATCHKKLVHWWDSKLRNYYRDSFTDKDNFMNIPFQKPNNTFF